jgi:peptide/nickel transport system permease protein
MIRTITAAPHAPREKYEFLYFAFRNTKLRLGLGILLFFLILSIVGPALATYDPTEFVGPSGAPPSADHWLGTTSFGEDVFSQFVHGLGSTFLVGIIGGGLGTLLGMTIGFTAGYRGGVVDEVLNVLTNVTLTLPALALLLVLSAYAKVRNIFIESLFIGFTTWPWAARAIRAQTFTLRAREFVDLAKLSGRSPLKIVISEIAPNMASYLFMTFILMFGNAILTAATLDFLGLGPTQGTSLGIMMNMAVLWSALPLGMWWWFVPPGIGITAIVGGLYIMNVGLDEVFNPRLRKI